MPGFFIFAGDHLRELRDARGWTREQLAVSSGCSVAMVASAELGYRNPSRRLMLRWAAALGVSPRDLVAEDPMFSEAAR